MLSRPDFHKKQILIYCPKEGDKLSYRNDNILITDKSGKVKCQSTCYQAFSLYVIGNISITSGLIMRARKFRYAIVLMTPSLRTYQVIGNFLEGNTYLHRKQYQYRGLELGRHIIENKIINQREILNRIRRKVPQVKEAIELLDQSIARLHNGEVTELQSLLGFEGSASRVYFSSLFLVANWHGRKPRVKNDYINSLMDIGYTMLFNFVDSLLQLYGFDTYCGVLHTEFYMRKSLVCDIMEPFRPLIDWKIRCAINLHQFEEADFDVIKGQYHLQIKKNAKYTAAFMETLLTYKDEMFSYVQSYYRAFMKGIPSAQFPQFLIAQCDKEEVMKDYLN